MTNTFKTSLCCATILVALPVMPALAQDNATDAAESSGSIDSPASSPIIVTASRREESIQDVPISITAFDGETLETLGIDDTLSLQQVTPGLVFNQNTIFAQPYIRGVGTDITPPGSESSVATFIDGVYQPFPFVGIQVLNGIERIEVLKGPQGTLYGRNATGGSINVQTRVPEDYFTASGDISYGNYDAIRGNAYVSVPFSDNVAANVAVAISNRDGFGTDRSTGTDYNSEDYQYVRGRLRVDATPDLQFILSGYYFHRNDDAYMAYTYADQFGSIPLAPQLGGRVTINSQDTYTFYDLQNRINDWGGNLRATWSIGSGELVSITAYQNARALIGPDFLSTDIPVFDFYADEDTGESFSQDLYYTGSTGDVSYVIGGTYANSSARFDALDVYVGTALATRSFQYADTEAFAIYGEATYDITPELSITGGLRYSNETKTQDRLDTFLADGTQIQSTPQSSRSWDNVSVKAVAQYDTGPLMIYGSFQTGFKSGTVVVGQPGVFIPPERIQAFEAGFRADVIDRTFTINGAAFYYRFKNLQTQYTDITTGSALVESADRARIFGAEIQANIRPTDNLSFNVGLNLLDGEYTNYISSGAFIPNDQLIPGVGGNSAVTADLSGRNITRTPPITLNVGGSWTIPDFLGGTLQTTANLFLSDSYFFDPTNRTYQDSYSTLNAQVEYTFPGDRFSVALFGRNITDTEYYAVVTPIQFGDQAALAAPRTYGLRLSVDF